MHHSGCPEVAERGGRARLSGAQGGWAGSPQKPKTTALVARFSLTTSVGARSWVAGDCLGVGKPGSRGWGC
jgi:hypothetical protein